MNTPIAIHSIYRLYEQDKQNVFPNKPLNSGVHVSKVIDILINLFRFVYILIDFYIDLYRYKCI